MPRRDAYIGIGSNLGDRAAHIRHAHRRLGELPDTDLTAASAVHETAPVGPIAQGPYLNAVARLSTALEPATLLACLHAIELERQRDRAREQRWGPRTLDLDILLLGDLVHAEPGLTIPHPRLHERTFVLVPLAELAPELTLPGSGRTVQQLLASLTAETRAPGDDR